MNLNVVVNEKRGIKPKFTGLETDSAAFSAVRDKGKDPRTFIFKYIKHTLLEL